ncbi:MAG: hypothetical protein LBR65_03050 [Culturomica sp.]|jgi:hypothetical protein|nr:hypothetical protein [Culturomica sp.]
MLSYAYLSPHTEEKAAEIRRRIRRLQNGGTVESLRRIGADTSGQIGAGYVSLRELAGRYAPEEALATLLWGTGQREEQIVACLLFPDTLNKEKITQLADNCSSLEVAEYFGSLLLSRSKALAEIAPEFGNSGVPARQVAALTGCARHLRLNRSNPLITQAFFTSLANRRYPEKYAELVASRYR